MPFPRGSVSRSCSLTALFALSACHTATGAVTTPGVGGTSEPPPANLLEAPAGSYGAVIVHEDAPYLFASFAIQYEGAVPPTPAGPAPATVQLLTPTGPCDAQVGEPVSLSTGVCETSTTVARPLSGCNGPFARVARVAGSWPEEARYLPLTEPTEQPFTTASELTDELHRARVQAWMSEPTIGEQPLRRAVSAHALLNAGSDILETSAVTFLVGPEEPECEQSMERRDTSTLRRDGRLVTIEELPRWQGVVAYRGRIAGVFADAPYYALLVSFSPEGLPREEFRERVWSDNEECASFAWAQLEHPCAM